MIAAKKTPTVETEDELPEITQDTVATFSDEVCDLVPIYGRC